MLNQLTEIPGAASPTSLLLPSSLEFNQWVEIGEKILAANQSTKWWLGDWINYGESVYGEKYAQALEISKLDYRTLMNVAYTCRKIPKEIRRQSLPFAHHYEVASLDAEEQVKFLDAAEQNEYTSKDVRDAVRAYKNPEPPSEQRIYQIEIRADVSLDIEAESEERAREKILKAVKKEIVDEDITHVAVLNPD